MDDALKQLRGLHLPEPPGLWPPAPGWWILAILVAAALIALAIRIYRTRRRARPLRLAVGALDRLLADNRDARLSPRDFANAVNELLKRALIYGAHRSDAAPLTGPAWLTYLDGIVASDVFSNGAGAALGSGASHGLRTGSGGAARRRAVLRAVTKLARQ
jgi:hypothetical protein